jgi:hypothetical protein
VCVCDCVCVSGSMNLVNNGKQKTSTRDISDIHSKKRLPLAPREPFDLFIVGETYVIVWINGKEEKHSEKFWFFFLSKL